MAKRTRIRPRATRGALPPVTDRARAALDALHRWLDHVQSGLPDDCPHAQCRYGMVLDGEAKHVQWRFDAARFAQLEIIQLTDVQFGSRACRTDRLIEYRDWILESPTRYCVWTGDMLDLWTPASPGTPAEQAILPGEAQFRAFVELMGPLRHRCLGYVGGNHERRTVPTFGDLGRLIATILRIPYSGGKQLIDIWYGSHRPFKLTLWHGRGAARTAGGIAQALERFAESTDAQVCLSGHLHRPLIMPLWRERRVERGYGVRLIKTIAAIGSSFLETWGSYAELSNFRATDVLMPRIVLGPDGTWELTLR